MPSQSCYRAAMTVETAVLPEIWFVQDKCDAESAWFEGVLSSEISCRVTLLRGLAETLDHLFDPDRELPAVVVLDYRLPNRIGVEILRRLRLDERTRLLPVVLFTSHGAELVS